MELRIKLSVFIVFLFFSSCGDPVNADKNIIKVRLVEGFEMFNENKDWIYTYKIIGTGISNFSIPLSIGYKPSAIKREDSNFSMIIEGTENTIDCSFRNDQLSFSTDPFEGRLLTSFSYYLLPNPTVLEGWRSLIKEWVGFAMSKVMGYI